MNIFIVNGLIKETAAVNLNSIKPLLCFTPFIKKFAHAITLALYKTFKSKYFDLYIQLLNCPMDLKLGMVIPVTVWYNLESVTTL